MVLPRAEDRAHRFHITKCRRRRRRRSMAVDPLAILATAKCDDNRPPSFLPAGGEGTMDETTEGVFDFKAVISNS